MLTLASVSPDIRRSLWPLLRALFCVLAGALALTVGSQVQVPLFLTPVPLTAQPQVVLALAALFGPRHATAALLTWFSAALFGAPVFAQGATGVALFGPTAGYLWSYVPAIALVGRFGRRPTFASFVVWQAAGALTLGCGALGLCLFVGKTPAWALGVKPFWVADVLKGSAAFLLCRPLLQRLSARPSPHEK